MIQRTHSPLAVLGKTIQMLLLLAYALFALFPLLWMVIMSLKPDSQMLTTTFIFTPTLENYTTVLHSDYTRFFFNNLIVSVAAVLVSLVVGVPAAYALARFQFKLKEDIAFTILSFRFAPEILVILPLYLIYQRLGLTHHPSSPNLDLARIF